eukprot:RCo014549
MPLLAASIFRRCVLSAGGVAGLWCVLSATAAKARAKEEIPNPPHPKGVLAVDSNKPFAEGRFRYAFRGKLTEPGGKVHNVVIKVVKKKYQDKYEDEEQAGMKAQFKAMELAELYNQNRNKKQKRARITFLPVWLQDMSCEVKADNGDVLIAKGQRVAVEPWLEGEYKKYSSNTGWVTQELLTPGAFGHFTWHKTHELVVCDLQGVHVWSTAAKEGQFLLTDPAVCSLSEEYGMSDLGQEGIAAFFKYHTCGHMCKGFMHDRPAFKHKRWAKQETTTAQGEEDTPTPTPKKSMPPQ